MTCGIAIPVEGKVVLASGSRILAGTHMLPEMNKVLSLPGGYTALSAGTLKAERRALVALRNLIANHPGESDILTMWTDLLVGLDIPSDDGMEFLIAKDGCLWQLDTDGTFYEDLKTFQTIGSGESIAFGYLGASSTPKTVVQAKALALRCLKFVSQHMVCEGPPFTVEVV